MQMKESLEKREENRGRQSKEAKSKTFAVVGVVGERRNVRSDCRSHPKEEEGEYSECLASRIGEKTFFFLFGKIK